jgi:hypothetical protein
MFHFSFYNSTTGTAPVELPGFYFYELLNLAGIYKYIGKKAFSLE